jgi:hypothetical protein
MSRMRLRSPLASQTLHFRQTCLDSVLYPVAGGRAVRRDSVPAVRTEVAERAGVGGGRCSDPNGSSEGNSSADQNLCNHLQFSPMVVEPTICAGALR